MKIIEVIADQGHLDTILGIGSQHGALDTWHGATAEDGRCAVRMLVTPDSRQAVLDALQSVLGGSDTARIVISPVEATLPRHEDDEEETKRKKKALSREELYDSIAKSAQLDRNYLLLVFLSTVVVAVGLLEDNVAIVIGAMVIAPFLGPNIALALGTSLGDNPLVWKALKTNLAGMVLALVLSAALGLIWTGELTSQELLARTNVGLDSVVLALASGAAAVLSMTTGLASVLVGVMVAVALLPPTATLGFMLGSGQHSLALGAALLLAVNVVCLNLTAKLGFLLVGIKPRTWLDQQRARQSMTSYIVFWVFLLGVLVTLILLRQQLA